MDRGGGYYLGSFCFQLAKEIAFWVHGPTSWDCGKEAGGMGLVNQEDSTNAFKALALSRGVLDSSSERELISSSAGSDQVLSGTRPGSEESTGPALGSMGELEGL